MAWPELAAFTQHANRVHEITQAWYDLRGEAKTMSTWAQNLLSELQRNNDAAIGDKEQFERILQPFLQKIYAILENASSLDQSFNQIKGKAMEWQGAADRWDNECSNRMLYDPVYSQCAARRTRLLEWASTLDSSFCQYISSADLLIRDLQEWINEVSSQFIGPVAELIKTPRQPAGQIPYEQTISKPATHGASQTYNSAQQKLHDRAASDMTRLGDFMKHGLIPFVNDTNELLYDRLNKLIEQVAKDPNYQKLREWTTLTSTAGSSHGDSFSESLSSFWSDFISYLKETPIMKVDYSKANLNDDYSKEDRDECKHFVLAFSKRVGIKDDWFKVLGRETRKNTDMIYRDLPQKNGEQKGHWRKEDLKNVQALADKGAFVIAIMPKPPDQPEGHIAVVVPSNLPSEKGKVEKGLPYVRDQHYPNKSVTINWAIKNWTNKRVHFYIYAPKSKVQNKN
jgi:hypothetical protein